MLVDVYIYNFETESSEKQVVTYWCGNSKPCVSPLLLLVFQLLNAEIAPESNFCIA